MVQKISPKNKIILIAKYFIKKNEKDRRDLDNKKIQKLLYYAQAWSLVINQKKMFPNKMEAWIHGPAIPEVWRVFKDFDFSAAHPEISDDEFTCLTKEEKKILDKVWQVYGKFDGGYLEVLTHNELPWQEARKGLSKSESSQNTISLDVMIKYYSKKLQDALARNHQEIKK